MSVLFLSLLLFLFLSFVIALTVFCPNLTVSLEIALNKFETISARLLSTTVR